MEVKWSVLLEQATRAAAEFIAAKKEKPVQWNLVDTIFMGARKQSVPSDNLIIQCTRNVSKVSLVIFFKENMVDHVKQKIAIRIHASCSFNNGRSASGGGMTHVQSAEEERVAADRCARGYSSTNR